MDDEVAVVEQDPTTVVRSLPAERAIAKFTQPMLDIIGEAPHVAVRGPGSDHEHVGDNDEVRDVEKGNISALLVDDRFSSGTRRCFGVLVGWDRDSLVKVNSDSRRENSLVHDGF